MQLDFGGFDPAFIGVTIRFENRRAWDFFQAFLKSKTPVPVSTLGDDERFEALSLASVISHEVRHFHDFLLSAYSARIFGTRITGLINELQTLPTLVAGDANCVPVPIPCWLRLGDAERAAVLADLGTHPSGRPLSPPRLSHRTRVDLDHPPARPVDGGPQPDFGALFDGGTYARQQIRQLAHNPRFVGSHGSFQPWQVFELSGYLTQIQDLWQTYGADETEFFLNYLRAPERNRNPYARIFQVAWSLWETLGESMNTALTSAMVTWSLLGSYKLDEWNACPTERFSRLWDYVRTSGFSEWQGDYFSLFDAWSARLKLSTVSQGLEETAEILRRRVDSAERRVSRLKGTPVGVADMELIYRVTSGVARASQHMADEFRNAPELYIEPFAYLESVDKFASPILRYSFDGSAIRPHDPAAFERQGYLTLWGARLDGEDVIRSWIVPFAASNFNFLDPHDVAAVAQNFGLTDFLFAETARVGFDVQVPGKLFFETGDIVPFELLSC